MESISRSMAEPASEIKTPKPFPFPNGVLKKHHHHHQPSRDESAGAVAGDEDDDDHGVYRECLRNYAASLGGHAVDGCGEFMPSPSADPAVPSSLLCAACGCHRNFHRRLSLPRSSAAAAPPSDDSDSDDSAGAGGEEVPHGPPDYSAPHMLLALSSGGGGGGGSGGQQPISPAAAPSTAATMMVPRKRFRTKFTAEQKTMMHELSERLGWRMRRHDEGFVEATCREIGVGKGVFKVWMHNNKHNFLGGASSRRREIVVPATAAAAGDPVGNNVAAEAGPHTPGGADGDAGAPAAAAAPAANGGQCSSTS